MEQTAVTPEVVHLRPPCMTPPAKCLDAREGSRTRSPGEFDRGDGSSCIPNCLQGGLGADPVRGPQAVRGTRPRAAFLVLRPPGFDAGDFPATRPLDASRGSPVASVAKTWKATRRRHARFVEECGVAARPPAAVPELPRMLSFLRAMERRKMLRTVPCWNSDRLSGSARAFVAWPERGTVNSRSGSAGPGRNLRPRLRGKSSGDGNGLEKGHAGEEPGPPGLVREARRRRGDGPVGGPGSSGAWSCAPIAVQTSRRARDPLGRNGARDGETCSRRNRCMLVRPLGDEGILGSAPLHRAGAGNELVTP